MLPKIVAVIGRGRGDLERLERAFTDDAFLVVVLAGRLQPIVNLFEFCSLLT